MNRSILTVGKLLQYANNKPFTVSLIEDNQMYLNGIASKIRDAVPNIRLGAFSRSSSFLNYLRHKPEIAIVDFNLDQRSELEGIELIRALKEKSPQTKIIVLTGDQDIKTAVNCLNEGVLDYIIKSDKAIDQIAEEIKSIMTTMIREIEQEAYHNTLNIILVVVGVTSIALLILKIFFPRLLET